MNDDENENENDNDNRIEMQATFSDLQRINIGGYQDLDNYIDAIGGKQNKLFRSDIEIFVHSVYNVGKELINNSILSSGDLDILLNDVNCFFLLDMINFKLISFIISIVISSYIILILL